MDVDHHALAVDVADLKVDRFADPQSQRVGGPDESFQPQRFAGVDDLENLGLGDDFGQRAGVVEFGVFEDIPVAFAGVAIEELDAAEQYALSVLRLNMTLQLLKYHIEFQLCFVRL